MLRLLSAGFVFVLLAHADSSAQTSSALHVLEAADYEAGTTVTSPPAAGKSGAASAVFEVTYEGFPDDARAAFDHALSIWGRHIASPVPITVRARWVELGKNVLGSAGPSTLMSFPGAPYPETWYPPALAAAITGRKMVNDGQYDIHASFSSEMTWYLGTDAAPPIGTYDFVTVVLHEIGHGIGMIGSFRVQDGDQENGNECTNATEGQGCWGYSALLTGTRPAIFDRFVSDLNDDHLINTARYPNPSTLLTETFESGAVFFSGASGHAAYQDRPIELFSPSAFRPASSIAHFDEGTFPAGDDNSLMTPQLARSEAIHTPGRLFCATLQDLGWPLGDMCVQLLEGPYLTDEESEGEEDAGDDSGDGSSGDSGDDSGDTSDEESDEGSGDDSGSGPVSADHPVDRLEDALVVQSIYPNPSSADVTVVVAPTLRQRVSASLHDVTGRTVWTGTIDVETGQAARLGFSVRELSPGIYFLRLVGTSGSTSASVVVGP